MSPYRRNRAQREETASQSLHLHYRRCISIKPPPSTMPIPETALFAKFQTLPWRHATSNGPRKTVRDSTDTEKEEGRGRDGSGEDKGVQVPRVRGTWTVWPQQTAAVDLDSKRSWRDLGPAANCRPESRWRHAQPRGCAPAADVHPPAAFRPFLCQSQT